MKRSLGVCYYPEHWPEESWADDARRMAETGLSLVRIGEFAWSRIEPEPGVFCWDWLDRAVETLGAAGLDVVLGTPSATPPRWMIDRFPDMLAVDAEGRPRRFGSRRHYSFSHAGYRAEAARIAGQMAERYGQNPHIVAWQTDNEYGCHDTTLSYCENARREFRNWLRARHGGDIAALNAAWGNVFWSMEYADFDQIDLPNLTVTEPNPAHVLAFRRFSSDQVVAFNRAQVAAIRAHAAQPILHNYMGRTLDFDHFAVGADLDIAAWDSYPLGFLEDRIAAPAEFKRAFARQGDPDFQAFHHDLYRAVGGGRWWVMEQQPGPVNWAPYNPDPAPGMVRLWAWEAFAHGAEVVSFFRWRQAPFAQEQMHAGLLRPDDVPAPGLAEAARVAREIAEAPQAVRETAPVALIFDYEADWYWTTQPHGWGLSYFDLVFDTYRALRRLGLSVDILPPGTRDFTGRKMILAPGLVHMSEELKAALARADAEVILGPRTGQRDGEFRIPVPLPPGFPGLDLTVARVESLRPDMPRPLSGYGAVKGWFEHCEGKADTIEATRDGQPAVFRQGRTTYVAGWLDEAGLGHLIERVAARAGLAIEPMPGALRRRELGPETFWFNYGAQPIYHAGRLIPAFGVLREVRGEPGG